ncbi:hypothetical protein QR680_004656 [Steinernema hermaphroditum]|uniref:Uncharacterized protein n=1 Tax=Steinernema hermaphroditum TaxID=289476 RepID=A0AA39HQG3_9BILA|nr:hypothetical protein QR680_004656 [Steinernema hermaphroditum]
MYERLCRRTILCTWLYLTIFISLMTLGGCKKNFKANGFYFRFYCPTKNSADWANALQGFWSYQSYVLPCVMFVIYVILVLYIQFGFNYALIGCRLVRVTVVQRTSNTSKTRRRTEIRLLIQTVSKEYVELMTIHDLTVGNNMYIKTVNEEKSVATKKQMEN